MKIRRGSNEPHLVGSFYNGIYTPPFGGGNAHDLLKNRLKIALRRKREADRYLDQRFIGEHQIVTRLVDLFFMARSRFRGRKRTEN